MKIARTLALLALAVAASCAPPPPNFPTPELVAYPNADEVESVLFLVGDAGDAPYGASPILARLRQDVDFWAEQVQGDSAIAVLYLGDIIYPLGLNPRESPEFTSDSLTVMAQVEVVAGDSARGRAHSFFLLGNHDWGLEEDWGGFVRAQRLGDFLAAASERTGASARLAPDAGTGGPFVVDIGDRLRLLLLDTAWWILDGGQLGLDSQGEVLAGVRDAILEAGDREIVIAAHHPFRSAGPHGGEFSFWRTLGVRYLLVRSGALLQDITSVPYRELAEGLRQVFETTRVPLLFAGGHEHSLQVFEAVRPSDPSFSIVSGSGSKLSSLGTQSGMVFGRSAPGYMKVIVERDGDVSLFVESAPEEFLMCPQEDPARATCMAEGIAAFEVVYSSYLR